MFNTDGNFDKYEYSLLLDASGDVILGVEPSSCYGSPARDAAQDPAG